MYAQKITIIFHLNQTLFVGINTSAQHIGLKNRRHIHIFVYSFKYIFINNMLVIKRRQAGSLCVYCLIIRYLQIATQFAVKGCFSVCGRNNQYTPTLSYVFIYGLYKTTALLFNLV